MTFGANMSGRAINNKALPVTCEPYSDEVFGSYIERVAAKNGISSYELLLHVLGEEEAGESPLGISYFAANSEQKIENLSRSLHLDPNALSRCAFPRSFIHFDKNDFCLQSASKNIQLLRSEYSPILRPSWCPHCLMENQLNGNDQYLRRDWALSWRTICPKHFRPLNERCTACYQYLMSPAFVRSGNAVRLHCPKCFSPLDAQLGFDFLSSKNSADWMGNDEVYNIWKRIAQLESYCIRGRGKKNAVSWSYILASQFITILNLFLLASEFENLRLIDLMPSPWFPTRDTDRSATQSIEALFCIARLTDRRKAIALMLAWIENDFRTFGFQKYDFEMVLFDGKQNKWSVENILEQYVSMTGRLLKFS